MAKRLLKARTFQGDQRLPPLTRGRAALALTLILIPLHLHQWFLTSGKFPTSGERRVAGGELILTISEIEPNIVSIVAKK